MEREGSRKNNQWQVAYKMVVRVTDLSEALSEMINQNGVFTQYPLYLAAVRHKVRLASLDLFHLISGVYTDAKLSLVSTFERGKKRCATVTDKKQTGKHALRHGLQINSSYRKCRVQTLSDCI